MYMNIIQLACCRYFELMYHFVSVNIIIIIRLVRNILQWRLRETYNILLLQ